MYALIRPLLFQLDPEVAHRVSLNLLHFVPGFCFSKSKESPVNALGRDFLHPIGLAAGLDKNAEHIDALARLGFSYIEVGTVTPRPQLGNSTPRLFRLPQAEAIINRMGFNNQGVDALVRNIQRANYTGILGVNIGKNKETSLDNAIDDYLHCFKKVASYASYVTINISSPNTPDLRQLQQSDYFSQLIKALDQERQKQVDKQQRDIPLVVKVSPDESNEHLKEMADLAVVHGIDGIIATNTTNARDKVGDAPHAEEAGGVSGQPLAERATECVSLIRGVVGNSLTLIASGGIDNPRVAQEKLAAGADLLQLYTGLIYKGPGLVHQLVKALP